MSAPDLEVGMLLESVRLRAIDLVPQPRDGERVLDYGLRCAQLGALLAVEPVSAICLATQARLASAAATRLPRPQTDPTRRGGEEEGTTT